MEKDLKRRCVLYGERVGCPVGVHEFERLLNPEAEDKFDEYEACLKCDNRVLKIQEPKCPVCDSGVEWRPRIRIEFKGEAAYPYKCQNIGCQARLVSSKEF
jgi:hypothetical protein